VFCDTCCVRIDKYVFIVVKIKCVNSGRISDICDKVNFTINYTYFTIPDNILSKHTQHFIKIHTDIIIFYTFSGTVPQARPKNFPIDRLTNGVGWKDQ
jgi:hypothetical protein